MSANLHSIEETFTEQLADFDTKLRERDDNASLLKEIHSAITLLMSRSGDRDDEIREILQKRYNAGRLRLETYQLVRNVLDRVVIESMATMPDAVDEPEYEDSHRKTTVIDKPKEGDDAPQDRLQVGSVLRDRFLLQERVAGGSMGVVYKALDRRIAEADGFDPWVAIKVLSPRLSKNGHALRALQQEAAKGRCLSHPNIVRFIDLDRDDEMYFIVMEWLEGRSLAAILDANKNQNLDRTTAMDIVRQVGLALDYAHRCGVVHADVKPANIMVTPSGQVKLFDFGIARIRQKQHQTRKDFDPGVLGAITPAYSSMQVLTGEDPLPADDVFSLGCLMYRLVAGHRVFGPRNAAEAAEQGLEPQRPPGLSDPEWRALKKSLAYSRVSRFASPAEFLAALDAEERQTVTHTPTHDEPIIVEPKRTAPAPRRPWGVAAALLITVAAALLLVSRPELIGRIQNAGQSLTEQAKSLTGPAAERPGEPAVDSGVPLAETAGDPADADAVATGGENSGEDRVAGEPAITPYPDPGLTEPGRADDAIEIPREAAMSQDAVGSQAGQDSAPAGPEPISPVQQNSVAEGPDEAGPTILSAATITVPLASRGSFRAERDLTLREDGEPAIVELVRESGLREPLTVLVEEVGFSGNRSPLTSGRYRLSDKTVQFGAGQKNARITVSMSSDAVREADRHATLLLRNAVNSTSHFAVVNLTLEDDDQRAFESGLPLNTLGFSESQMFVHERDPAVQIDVLRFNPGDAPLEVDYFISGGTASEGDDYFVPGATSLVFGPGQRAARLLIPLVQDSRAEDDETFTLELVTDSAAPLPDIYRQITVIMQDDDSAF